MPTIRMTRPIDPELRHDCDLMQIDGYSLRETLLPGREGRPPGKAISIVIRGRNFRAVAQPLRAYVGEIPVRYLRIAPDERSVEGVLLQEPPPGSLVTVILGDQDSAQHPTPVEPGLIQRMG